MKSFVVAVTLLAVAYAAPQNLSDRDAPIVKQDSDVNPEGYQWAYETGNGISAQESGGLKNAGGEQPSIAAQGGFRYTAPDGQVIELQYGADENGFQPQGAHLPTAPPVPEAIQKALAYLATLPPNPENNRF